MYKVFQLYRNQFHVNFDQIQIVEVITKSGHRRTELWIIMEMELLQGVISGIGQQISIQSGDLPDLLGLVERIKHRI